MEAITILEWQVAMTYELSRNIEQLQSSATEELDNTIKRLAREEKKNILSLGVGEPSFATPDNIVHAACEALKAGMTKYQPTAGDVTLREAIRDKLRCQNGIEASPDQIIVTPGAKFAIYLAFQAILDPGDAVLIMDPSWVSHGCIPTIMGAQVIRVACSEMDDYQPDIAMVRKAMRQGVKAVVVNSPCNPTGAVYEKTILRQIAELAADHGAILISDEVYEHLIFDGEHFSPGSEYGNVLTVNGFSKAYAMTGWRLGYVTGPETILKGMIKIYQHSVSCVTAFTQAGGIEALHASESRSAMKSMIDNYRKRRDVMMDILEQSPFFECRVAQGAFYCFPSYVTSQPSVDLARELLEETSVAVVPGSAFGEGGERHLRLSYSVSEEDIIEAFTRMESFFRKRL